MRPSPHQDLRVSPAGAFPFARAAIASAHIIPHLGDLGAQKRRSLRLPESRASGIPWFLPNGGKPGKARAGKFRFGAIT